MFAWNGIRNEGTLSSFEPATALADTSSQGGDDLGVTFGVTPTEVVLGESVGFTASVNVTNTGLFTMTWDYGDGMGSAGPVTGTDDLVFPDTGTVPYIYTTPGTYNATANVSQTETVSDVVTTDLQVTVTGPSLSIPTAADFGESIEVTIDNYSANAITGTNLVITSPSGMVYNVAVPVGDIGPDGTATTDVPYDENGTYEVAATLFAAGSFELNEDGDTEVTVTGDVLVNAGATLEAAPTPVDIGNTVTFTGTLSGVLTDSVTSYTLDFGDDSDPTSPATGTLSFTETTTYASAGTYTATLTAVLDGSTPVTLTDTATVVVSGTTTAEVESLTIGTDPATLTADGTSTSDVAVTALDSDSNPVEGVTVTVTLPASGNLGTRLEGSLNVSGTTDADGVFTTTLTAGNVPGEVTLTATSGSVEQTANVTLEISGGGVLPVTFSPDSEVDVTFEVDGRQFRLFSPAQGGLSGPLPLYLVISPDAIDAADVPTGTLVYGFSLDAYFGEGTATEGEPLSTVEAINAGFDFDGVIVEVSYAPDNLDALGVFADTLELFDTANQDGMGTLSDEPVPASTVLLGVQRVKGDVQQFGRHAIIGFEFTNMYLPLVLQ
jgi:hypothetical protein